MTLLLAFTFRAAWLALRIGWKSLFLHKLRSALTVLGILIGVTAVIWLVAMGEGVSYQAQEQIKSLGATSIIIRSIKPTEQSSVGMSGGLFFAYGLLREDFDRIISTVPAIVQAIPMREISRPVNFGDRSMDCRLVGCTSDYLNLNHLQIDRGRFLSEHDIGRNDNVAVIAAQTAEFLFPYEDPIGKSIQVISDFYVIVGQTRSRVPSAAIGGSLAAQDFDFDVYIPLTTFRARIGDKIITLRSGSFQGDIVELSQISVKVDRIEDVDETAKMIEELLSRFHRVKDYSITVPKELLEQAENLRLLFLVLLVLIAGISLIVGGIGIMNIMLATVSERTKEIGIRRALGAKQSHIMWQFLIETLILSLAGGILGVVLGLLCGPTVAGLQELGKRSFPEVYDTLPNSIQNLEPRIATWSIVVSLLIAVLVGLFFGLYPARRAARMDPIEALRHE